MVHISFHRLSEARKWTLLLYEALTSWISAPRDLVAAGAWRKSQKTAPTIGGRTRMNSEQAPSSRPSRVSMIWPCCALVISLGQSTEFHSGIAAS